MFIDPRSKNLINELNNYCWDLNKDDYPIDKFNHALDALRYIVTYLTRKGVDKDLGIY
jgi:phage terminase large subunit